ncbi:hypothetical protein CPB85DRAFT_1453267 [Mucidula mucida]|nr:hypothetical protein CPB85DRAFT_1453267 [Mucidula mucida]
MSDGAQNYERALQHIVEFLLVLADPGPFDKPLLPNSRRYFRASITSPSFLILILRVWYWTMGIIKTLLRRCALQTAQNIVVADNTLNLLCTCIAHIGTVLATEGRRWIAVKMRIIDLQESECQASLYNLSPGTVFCSRECQRIDWQNHRTTCSTYAEALARAEPVFPEYRVWELLIIEAMLLHELKKGVRKEWYARLKEDFVTRNPAYTLHDLGYLSWTIRTTSACLKKAWSLSGGEWLGRGLK